MNDPRLALAGLVTGLLVGMTGMGGGSLMTPILIFFFNFNPATAIGTDILHGAIFKSFGAVQHRRLGTVRARLAAWMLVGSAPASLVGVWVATYLTDRYGDSVDSVQGQVLGYTLLFGAVAFVVKALTHRSGTASTLGRLSTRDRVIAVAIGVVGGFIVGLTSVGSGTLFALAMLLAYPLAAKYVVGTDIAHAAALLFVAGMGHLIAGNVDIPAMSWLLVGSIPGVLIGSRISVGLPETVLRMALATALALSGIKLLDVPHANEIVVVSLSVGLGALLVWGVIRLIRPASLSPVPFPRTALMSSRAPLPTHRAGVPLRLMPSNRPRFRLSLLVVLTVAVGVLAQTSSAEPEDNAPPVAVDDDISTAKGTPGDVNVLVNDSDPDDDPLTVESWTQGNDGSVTCTGAGLLVHAQQPDLRRDRLVHLHRGGRPRRNRHRARLRARHDDERPAGRRRR